MPVKNISAVGPSGNVKPIPVYHTIPPASAAIFKVTIDTSSGEIDITDSIMKATFNIGVNDSVGDCSIEFLDPNQTNNNLINLFDDVYLYADYGSSATTKRFRFKVENKGYLDFITSISGRGIGMILAEKSIIYQSVDGNGDITSKAKSTILQEILQQNFSDITDFSEIETDSTSIQKSYFEIPFLDIITDLCGKDKYFYLDKDLVPHYFTKGSDRNSTEVIADTNLVTIKENSDNTEKVYSKVRVYGKSENGIPILSTTNTGTTNTGGINKDYIINNSSVVTQDQADNLASTEATNLTSSSRIGNLISLLIPTFQPGQSIFINLPEYNISPTYYNISEFAIVIDNQGSYPITTQFTIESRRKNLPLITQEIVSSQKGVIENDNPNDLDFSRIVTFGTDTGTHSNTQISEGYLKVEPGNSTGTWISPIYTLDSDVSAIEVRWAGDNLAQDYITSSAQLWFSLNGGATWTLNPTSGTLSSIVSGRDLRFKVVFNSSDQRVKRIGGYFSF